MPATGPRAATQRPAPPGAENAPREARGAPGAPAAPGSDLAVVDPRDGQVLADIDGQPTGLLAHVALALKDREDQLHRMRKAVEAELARRVLAGQRKVVLVEDLELRVDRARGRVWDGDALEVALEELVMDGVLRAGELTGLVTRPTTVDGRMAQQLLGRLHGPALSAVQGCFTWETKGRPRLTITPNPPLLPEEGEA